MPNPTIYPNSTLGIDISHYQNDAGAMDWNAVATPPAPVNAPAFIYIKLTDGRTNDPQGIANATNAGNANIPLGYYHFAYPGLHAADVEANNFYNQVVATGVAPTLNYPYMLDLETNRGLNQDDFLAWVHLFIQTFKSQFGASPVPAVVIYGSPGNFNAWLPSDHDLGVYALWVAEYGVASPRIPTGWSDWLIWQYSETGTIPGITGNVDLDQAKQGLHT
jgi:lysozyme